jgi:hypothetical protein
MSGARRRALFAGSIALMAAAALAFTAVRHHFSPPQTRSLKDRPVLLLLTSLPLVFGEDFSLNGGSPALTRLETRYRVAPISVTSPAELAKGRLLLMAQPQAQTPENLVALDDWVRRGGRVLLLADPLLEWPSNRPLGDPLRPPPMFADTGLLAHWGLRLDAPDQRGIAARRLAGHNIVTDSPGTLYGRCGISSDRLVAECHAGKGEAMVVADADFIGMGNRTGDSPNNLDGLAAAVASLEQK